MISRLVVDQVEFCDRWGIYHSPQNVAYYSHRETRETCLVVQGVWYKGSLEAATGQILESLQKTNERVLQPEWYVEATLKSSLEKMNHLAAIQGFAVEIMAGGDK